MIKIRNSEDSVTVQRAFSVPQNAVETITTSDPATLEVNQLLSAMRKLQASKRSISVPGTVYPAMQNPDILGSRTAENVIPVVHANVTIYGGIQANELSMIQSDHNELYRRQGKDILQVTKAIGHNNRYGGKASDMFDENNRIEQLSIIDAEQTGHYLLEKEMSAFDGGAVYPLLETGGGLSPTKSNEGISTVLIGDRVPSVSG